MFPFIPLAAATIGANPVARDSVVVDLSALNRIVAFDPESGCVTVEPGVSQRQLAEFLERNGHDFMVPVTGAGPDGSILGNALERGYGITPLTDHFGAMRSLKAILPNGDEYTGALEAMGVEAATAFKWGIGPYLDGLFCQGAFGIVTQMTIALARRPEQLTAFFFWIDRDERLEDGVAAKTSYPFETVAGGAALTRDQLAALTKKIGVSAWMGAGAIYGCAEVNRGVKEVHGCRMHAFNCARPQAVITWAGVCLIQPRGPPRARGGTFARAHCA
jgi:4-cresol dehydrogenase (hydroxylating)